MIISWYGEGCFKIQNGEKTILIDPPEANLGFSVPRFRSNILIKSLTPWPFPFSQEAEKNNADFVIWGAGEYDIGEIKIRGFSLKSESSDKFFKSAFVVKWEEIVIGILGHLSLLPSPEILENFEEVDVLIAPAGGEPFLSQELLVKLVKQLNPKIYLPSFYKVAGLKRKAQGLEAILIHFNGEVEKMLEKFVFKKKDLAEIKKTKIVTFKI